MGLTMLHTCIRVVDMDSSIDFYTNGLGLVITKRLDHLKNGFELVYLSTHDGGYEIELTYNVGTNEYSIGNGFSHIAIGVDDLKIEHNKHFEMGYEVTDLKGLPGSEPHYYFVTDPDGYKIEVIQN